MIDSNKLVKHLEVVDFKIFIVFMSNKILIEGDPFLAKNAGC